MIAILVAIIVAAVVGIALLNHGEYNDTASGMLAHMAGFILLIVSGVSLMFYMLLAWDWIASEHKAKIINREYGTKYTREEVFYANDAIDTIRKIDRKRIEVNGNILGNNNVEE